MTNQREELLHEEYMSEEGRRRWQRKIDKMRNGGQPSPVARTLINHNLDRVSKAIASFVEAANTGKAGRRHASAKVLAEMSSDTLSYLTCRYVILGIAQGHNLGTVERHIGQAVEDELWLSQFEVENPGAYGWVARELERRGIKKRHQKRYMFLRIAEYKGVQFDRWLPQKHIQVGKALIELFARECGDLVDVGWRKEEQKTIKYLKGRPRLLEVLHDVEQVEDLILPRYLPMIAPPLEWSDEQDGGYYALPRSLVKDHKNVPPRFRSHQKELLKAADLTEVHSALNAVDGTPFRINRKILEVVQRAEAFGWEVAGMPKPEEVKPVFPEEAKTDPEAKIAWKKEARAVYERNEKSMSKRIDLRLCLHAAEKCALYERIWLPNQLDFRGRVYQQATSLQNQGPDYARALLEFAEGKEVDDVGMRWLMIHGANMYGFDKASLDDRVEWTHQHRQEILEAAQDPWNSVHWRNADKPFQYLAWCFDYVGALEGKPSHCRVSMDGSCNGLQHLSALLKDPEGARAVNLVSGHVPADVYQEVADLVVKELKQAEGQEREWAREFLKIGFDRKMTKRAVMVMPYGGTVSSTKKYVEEAFYERVEDCPFGEDRVAAIRYIGDLVYKATRDVIKGGAVVMAWLQEIASLASKEAVHLSWTTPHGFIASQLYFRSEMIRVRSTLDGAGQYSVRTSHNVPVDKVAGAKSRNGIAPNFVHSLDACAMMRTINLARSRGVEAFHMVHDDYGTHAADTQVLYEALRESFVEMYEDGLILKRFRDEVQQHVKVVLPEPPQSLGFDIRQVLESTYFFS